MNIQNEIPLVNKLSENERLSKIIEAKAQQNNLIPKFVFEINVALDEVLTNIISYAYNDDKGHIILVKLFFFENELKVQVEDDGIAFNSLERAEPDITKSVLERPIGGLGIHMIKKLVYHLNYKRKNGKKCSHFNQK